MISKLNDVLVARSVLVILILLMILGCLVKQSRATATTEQVADIIYDNHRTINAEQIPLTEEQAYLAANEILYLIGEYEMNIEEDLPYILSLYYQESKFDPLAKNPTSSARGFGQILISMHNHKFDEVEGDWRDIEANIYVSFQILSYDPDITNPRSRWINALTGYCGSRLAAINTVRHHEHFEDLLNDVS